MTLPGAHTECHDLTNDLSPLTAALSWLESKSISVWVFGGWGEQLRALCRPRAHGDIDLLYPGETWDGIDTLIVNAGLEEIVAKRFAHKPAIVWQGTMVELFLVHFDDRGPHTLFWDRVRHDWPVDVLGYVGEIPVASAAALCGYRRVTAASTNRVTRPRLTSLHPEISARPTLDERRASHRQRA